MICAHCHYEVNEREVIWNDDCPAQPYHPECYEEAYCECGHKAWDRGFCIDCLSNAEAILENMYEDDMHEGMANAKRQVF